MKIASENTFEKQRVTFFYLLRKEKTIVGFAYGPIPQQLTKFDWGRYNTWLSDFSANRTVFPRTGD